MIEQAARCDALGSRTAAHDALGSPRARGRVGCEGRADLRGVERVPGERGALPRAVRPAGRGLPAAVRRVLVPHARHGREIDQGTRPLGLQPPLAEGELPHRRGRDARARVAVAAVATGPRRRRRHHPPPPHRSHPQSLLVRGPRGHQAGPDSARRVRRLGRGARRGLEGPLGHAALDGPGELLRALLRVGAAAAAGARGPRGRAARARGPRRARHGVPRVARVRRVRRGAALLPRRRRPGARLPRRRGREPDRARLREEVALRRRRLCGAAPGLGAGAGRARAPLRGERAGPRPLRRRRRGLPRARRARTRRSRRATRRPIARRYDDEVMYRGLRARATRA